MEVAMSIPTTVRMDEETISRLDGLAKSTGRSRAFIIKEALSRYLEYETWFVKEVAKGREAAEAGNLVSHEEVKARLRGRGLRVD
jgi:predicted transcriptional regulator